jgi:hypothetical protein
VPIVRALVVPVLGLSLRRVPAKTVTACQCYKKRCHGPVACNARTVERVGVLPEPADPRAEPTPMCPTCAARAVKSGYYRYAEVPDVLP